MLPKGGGTFVAADSVPVVARFLAGHPEGVLPGEFDYAGLIGQCRDFVEMTGQAGDVVLLHLGVDRLDFVPTAPRESVVPDRVRRQRARAVAENARLAAAERTI
jgi:hypothetical protein